MMMNPQRTLFAIVVFATIALSLSATTRPAPHGQDARRSSKGTNPPSTTAKKQESDGERIFEQNCSRCHAAPEGFSSRIAGTVVMHMRVRANLSKHDQEELMRFFNP
jgi:cytochrome c5